jgi:hypothetical protein
MLTDKNISKGGLIGAISGILVSLFIHKATDSAGRKAVKTGSMGILGYLLGNFAERKIEEKNNRTF